MSPVFQEIHVKLKKLAEATMWLPGFAPDDPLPASIRAFPDGGNHRFSIHRSGTGIAQIGEVDAEELPQLVETACRPEVGMPRKVRDLWPQLDSALHSMLRGDVAKFEANLAAIALLSRLEAENRHPSDDECAILNRYTGWGGIPKAFNPDQEDPAWKARAESMPEILGEDYESAKGSVVNAHFTEVFVIEAIWEAVRRMGFRGGRVLEPSAGVGYFIGAMPKDLAEASEITAIEIDRVSSRILSRLYGHHGVRTLHGRF